MKSLEIMRYAQSGLAAAEEYDRLAVRLLDDCRKPRKLLITARRSGEGATYVAVRLLRALAELRQRVVLVDADLTASRLTADARRRLSGAALPGLKQYLQGRISLEEIVYRTDIPSAGIVPAGDSRGRALPLFASDRLNELLSALAEGGALVLVDAPPVLTAAETARIARAADAALLVAAAGQGRREELAEAKAALEQAGCPVLGTVLNSVDTRLPINRRYYFHSQRFTVSRLMRQGAAKPQTVPGRSARSSQEERRQDGH